jgi:hypothetical protein
MRHRATPGQWHDLLGYQSSGPRASQWRTAPPPRAQPWTVSGAVGSALHDELHDHGDAFPNLAEIPAHEVLPDSSWELGLRLLLDGLQTKIDMLIAS